MQAINYDSGKAIPYIVIYF